MASSLGKIEHDTNTYKHLKTIYHRKTYGGSNYLFLMALGIASFHLDQKIGKAIYVSDLDTASIMSQLQGKVVGIQIRGASSFY